MRSRVCGWGRVEGGGMGNALRLGMTYCRRLKWAWGGFGKRGKERGIL
jgi:hypothetical protein